MRILLILLALSRASALPSLEAPTLPRLVPVAMHLRGGVPLNEKQVMHPKSDPVAGSSPRQRGGFSCRFLPRDPQVIGSMAALFVPSGLLFMVSPKAAGRLYRMHEVPVRSQPCYYWPLLPHSSQTRRGAKLPSAGHQEPCPASVVPTTFSSPAPLTPASLLA